ncbi:MAG: hypothetical protein FWF73_06630 [Spirochaetes bacterium]|nr:hypothetical protein [Spirochaetota bacterium]
MKDIEKSIKLYEMMRDRCEKNGFSKRQAQVYREMVEFMRPCETAQEAADKIKNSKYYLLPTAALFQDRMEANLKAAEENEMPDVADVYRQKIDEIEKDINAMYVTGYERTAFNKKSLYLETIEAFCALYFDYFYYSVKQRKADFFGSGDTKEDLKKGLNRLSKPSSDISFLAAKEKFRKLIPCTDKGYKNFVDEVVPMAEKGIDESEENKKVENEFKKAWDIIKAKKEEIIEIGKINLATIKYKEILVISPESKTGKYTFEEVM